MCSHVLLSWRLRCALVRVAHAGQFMDGDEDEDGVKLRERHASFRTGAGHRIQWQNSRLASSKKYRRRWTDASMTQDTAGGCIASGKYPANTGHMVRMKRSEAWSKFLAYEGCCQVWHAAGWFWTCIITAEG